MPNKDTPSIKRGELDSTTKDELIKELQTEVADLKDRRLEERFLWGLIFVISMDIWLLGDMNNWVAPTGIFILEFLMLIILARKCGVKDVRMFIDIIMSVIMRTKN